MCRDSQCRAAAGKQCFSVGICIYQVVARAISSSGSVCCGWERFIEKVIQYNYIGVETAEDVKALEAHVPPIFFECCTYGERERLHILAMSSPSFGVSLQGPCYSIIFLAHTHCLI